MARYIDADALIKKIFPYDGVDKRHYSINAKAIYDAINAAPTADIVSTSQVYGAVIAEIAEKLKHNNTIFGNCASRLVSNDYSDGRLGAYEEFVDILTELTKKYFWEEGG